MAKPPTSPPSSDIDGVDEDQTRNIDIAIRNGEAAGELDRAAKQDRARPLHTDEESKDERAR